MGSGEMMKVNYQIPRFEATEKWVDISKHPKRLSNEPVIVSFTACTKDETSFDHPDPTTGAYFTKAFVKAADDTEKNIDVYGLYQSFNNDCLSVRMHGSTNANGETVYHEKRRGEEFDKYVKRNKNKDTCSDCKGYGFFRCDRGCDDARMRGVQDIGVQDARCDVCTCPVCKGTGKGGMTDAEFQAYRKKKVKQTPRCETNAEALNLRSLNIDHLFNGICDANGKIFECYKERRF